MSIVSDGGYRRNDYIVTTRPLVVVTAPAGSANSPHACPQLYRENKRSIAARLCNTRRSRSGTCRSITR